MEDVFLRELPYQCIDSLCFQITGFVIGVVPQIRTFLIGSNAPLHVIEDTAFMLGYASYFHLRKFKVLEGQNLCRKLAYSGFRENPLSLFIIYFLNVAVGSLFSIA